MDKMVAEGIENWTHDQIVVRTANRAKEIAKTRNRKDNPDGWSPLTRIMRLKVKILGMLYRKLEDNKGVGDCYKTYKEVKRNMRAIELSEEFGSMRMEWRLCFQSGALGKPGWTSRRWPKRLGISTGSLQAK